LRDAPGLSREHWLIYDARLKKVRQELDAARDDLDQQRKRELEAWARLHGKRIDWSGWDRQPTPLG
jgi:hypothetical protein